MTAGHSILATQKRWRHPSRNGLNEDGMGWRVGFVGLASRSAAEDD
jgi:hypothetical protein